MKEKLFSPITILALLILFIVNLTYFQSDNVDPLPPLTYADMEYQLVRAVAGNDHTLIQCGDYFGFKKLHSRGTEKDPGIVFAYQLLGIIDIFGT